MTTTSAAPAVGLAGRPNHGAAGARLSELFAKHGATVLGLCRLLLRHREEAEDAVQQTFLSAYRSLLNGVEPRHPAAWLATIARNECWSRVEQRMREPLGDGEAEPESTLPDPVAAAAAKADLAALWRAIGELPRQQRQALLLREFSGLSYGELAEALAVSEPAVESLLFRARRELRVRLKPAYSSISGVAPLAAIREALGRAIGGMPDPAAAGALAKIAAAPLVAKLAAGAAAVVIAGGTVAAVESGAIAGSKPPTADPVADVTDSPPVLPAREPVPVLAATAVTPKVKRPSVTTVARTQRPRRALVASPVSAPAWPKRKPPAGVTLVAEAPAGQTPSEAPGVVPAAPSPAPAQSPAPAREPSSGPLSSSGDKAVPPEEDDGSGSGSVSGSSGSEDEDDDEVSEEEEEDDDEGAEDEDGEDDEDDSGSSGESDDDSDDNSGSGSGTSGGSGGEAEGSGSGSSDEGDEGSEDSGGSGAEAEEEDSDSSGPGGGGGDSDDDSGGGNSGHGGDGEDDGL